jgi:hypothetical protein
MVEGLDSSVTDKYEVLRDGAFLREFGPVKEVVQEMINKIGNDGEKLRKSLADLGIKVTQSDYDSGIQQYLERLQQGDRAVRNHYGSIAMRFRAI